MSIRIVNGKPFIHKESKRHVRLKSFLTDYFQMFYNVGDVHIEDITFTSFLIRISVNGVGNISFVYSTLIDFQQNKMWFEKAYLLELLEMRGLN